MLRSRRQLVTSEPPLVVVRERRRTFIKLVTASASSVVLQACGGGGSSNAATGGSVTAPITPVTPTTPPVTTPETPGLPAWSAIPALTFVQGIASSIPVGQYVGNAAAQAMSIALTAGQLPAGVTFNAATRSFDYDGSGAVASADGFVLTATV